jgi:hypothetical protein
MDHSNGGRISQRGPDRIDASRTVRDVIGRKLQTLEGLPHKSAWTGFAVVCLARALDNVLCDGLDQFLRRTNCIARTRLAGPLDLMDSCQHVGMVETFTMVSKVLEHARCSSASSSDKRDAVALSDEIESVHSD